MRASQLGTAVGFAAGILLAGQAQALTILIDDWNVNNSIIASANGPAPATDISGRGGLGNGGSFWGSRVSVYANLVAGDAVTTEDCANCQQGHATNAANSIGHGYWSWSNTASNLEGDVSLFYQADVFGGDVVASFVNGAGAVLDQIWWQDLAVGSQTLTGAVNATGVEEIYLDWFSVGGNVDPTTQPAYGSVVTARDFGASAEFLDANFDNFQTTIPVPGSIALFALGIAGLGWYRHRAS